MEDKTVATQLKDLIVEHFNLGELQELCFEIGFDYEELPNTKGEKSINVIVLLKTLHQKDLLSQFVNLCEEKRPFIEWPDAPTELYFEEDLQTEAQLQQALDDYKIYILGKWGRDPLLDGPLDNFYIWLEGQGPEEKKLKEVSSPPETSKDSSPESSSEDSEASKQNQDKKEPQYVSYYPPPLVLQEALEKHERLIVLGTAGTGKSTFLRRLVYQKTTNDSSTIPIWVSLSDYAKAIENPQPGSKTGLKQWAIEAAHEDPTIQAILNKAVEDNQVLWLLDGFDETGKQMNKVADAIAGLHSKNKLVLTTRPDTRLKEHQHRFNATQYEMRNLSQPDVEQFLQKRFDDPDETSKVLKWLADTNHPQRRELITKPLHLVLLATIVKETGLENLRDTRVQLYGKFIAIFLGKQIDKQNSEEGVDEFQLGEELTGTKARDAALQGFHYLGWVLFHQETQSIDNRQPIKDNRPTVKEQVVTCLHEGKGYSLENATAIFSFWQRIGVQKSFHQTFWPYAAACKLYDDWQRDAESTWHFLSSAARKLPYASRLHHPAWQEPIFMLTALMTEKKQLNEDDNQLDNLIERLLSKRDKEERYLHRNLRLAAAILGEVGSGEITKKHELKIVNQLGRLTRNYSKMRSITWSVTMVGLFASGLLVFYHFLPLFYFGILAALWVFSWVTWEGHSQLPRILKIPGKIVWHLVRNTHIAFTHILRLIGYDSLYPQIFVAALSSAGTASVPELENTFELSQRIEDELSYEVVKALGTTGSKEAVPFLSVIMSDIMNEGYGDIRLAAADSLRKIDHESATEALIRGIERNDYIALRGSSSWFPLPSSPFIISSTAVLPLSNALKNSHESGVRWLAAITLGEIGDKRAVPSLISALEEDSDFVSELATNALLQIGAVSIPDLHKALNKESITNRTRYRIALILVDLCDFRAIHHLVPYLKEDGGHGIYKDTIRKVLVQAGKVNGDKAIHQYLRICKLDPQGEALRTTFLDVLEEIGLTHIVLELIDSVPFFGIQHFLLDALSVLGEQGIVIPNDYEHDLIHIANNNAHKGKWYDNKIIKILGYIGSEAAIPNLLGILNHNQHICSEIAQNPTNYEYIRTLTKDFENWGHIEKATVQALGKIKAEEALSVLTQIITFDNKKVSDAITATKGQEDSHTSKTFMPDYFCYPIELKDLRVAAAIALKEIGNITTLDLICNALAKNDNEGRIDAVNALGIIGDVKAVPPLINIITTANSNFPWKEADIYKATTIALGLIGDARAVPHLIDLIENSHDSGIQDAAMKALKQIEIDVTDEETISILIEALGNWRDQIHQPATEILTQMGNSVVTLLCDASKSSNDQQVRQRIMQILGEIGDRNAIPLLLEALESSDKSVSRGAVQALAKIRSIEEDGFEKLVEAFNDRQKSYLHAETAVALGQLAGSISDDNTLQSARKALWQRRFAHYKENVFLAYEKVVTSLTIAQVRQLLPNDVNLSAGSLTKTIFLSHLRDRKWLLLLFGALLLVAIETFSGLFAEILGPYMPSGIAGLAILLVIIIFLIAFQSHFHDSGNK